MIEAKKLFEDRFQKICLDIEDENYSDAPFGMDYEESKIWMLSHQETLKWVLEMM